MSLSFTGISRITDFEDFVNEYIENDDNMWFCEMYEHYPEINKWIRDSKTTHRCILCRTTEDNVIIAFCILKIKFDVAKHKTVMKLCSIYVVQGWRKHNVCNLLINHLIDECKKIRIDYIYTHTYKTMPSFEVLQKVGFVNTYSKRPLTNEYIFEKEIMDV